MTNPSPPSFITRPDGRTKGGTLRPLSAKLSYFHNADGSSKFTSGSTQVLCCVFGPTSPRHTFKEQSKEATVSVVFKKSLGTQDMFYHTTERELERFLGDTIGSCVYLEEYPRSVIEVVIHVIKSDGSVIGCSLNGSILALMDAGVHMKYLPVATTCLVENGSGNNWNLLLDPCQEEEGSDKNSFVVFVNSNSGDGILSSLTSGPLTPLSYFAAQEGACIASKALLQFMRTTIEQKAKREAQTVWSSSKPLLKVIGKKCKIESELKRESKDLMQSEVET